jgi:hypothetical protein
MHGETPLNIDLGINNEIGTVRGILEGEREGKKEMKVKEYD